MIFVMLSKVLVAVIQLKFVRVDPLANGGSISVNLSL